MLTFFFVLWTILKVETVTKKENISHSGGVLWTWNTKMHRSQERALMQRWSSRPWTCCFKLRKNKVLHTFNQPKDNRTGWSDAGT